MRAEDKYESNNSADYMIITGFGQDGTRVKFTLYHTDGTVGDDICAISTIERWGHKINWKIKY